MPGYKGMRTLCEVLREIGGTAESMLEAKTSRDMFNIMSLINEKACEAIKMAKRMDMKLREYKADYDKDWFDGYCCVCKKTVKNSSGIAGDIYCNNCKINKR